MEKRSHGIYIDGDVPLECERTIEAGEKYITLFTTNQIQGNFSALSRDKDGLESDLSCKRRENYTLKNEFLKNRKTRRSSFIIKEGRNQVFRARPSSKRLPPLGDQNKESLSK